MHAPSCPLTPDRLPFSYTTISISFAPGGFGLQLAIINGEGAVVAFWWVNHKQTWKYETTRGILWSPRAKANGAAYQPYINMTIARQGDVIFSYANGRIGHVGIVDTEAGDSLKPDYATKTPWAEDGWLLPVTFCELPNPIVPKEHLTTIVRLLPKKYSPIQAGGDGNLSYLSAISDELGEYLLSLADVTVDRLTSSERADDVLDDLKTITDDTTLRLTDRLQLSRARVGQGLFRKRVLALEPACRVTGITAESLLRASHIKPWRDSSNAERLDGANGLMLSPHVDLLFDLHLISFSDEGNLLISTELDPSILEGWHIAKPIDPKPFNYVQKSYLKLHRSRLKRRS